LFPLFLGPFNLFLSRKVTAWSIAGGKEKGKQNKTKPGGKKSHPKYVKPDSRMLFKGVREVPRGKGTEKEGFLVFGGGGEKLPFCVENNGYS